MTELTLTDTQIDAEIARAEAWIDHHLAIQKTSLDLSFNVRLADGIDRMKAHVQALKACLHRDHQYTLFRAL